MSYTTKDCIDDWASWNEDGSPEPTQWSSSVSYVRSDLYSYRTLVARYYGKNDRKYVLLTSHRYGVTTSHHLGKARRCISVPIFTVENVVPAMGLSFDDMHRLNLACLRSKLEEQENLAIRNFKNLSGRLYLVKRAEDMAKDMLHYCELSGAPAEQLPSADSVIKRILSAIGYKWDKYNEPKVVARRVRIAARKEAIEAFNLQEKK